LRVRRDREGLAGHELALSRIVLLGEALGVDQLLVDARREPLEHREVLLLFGTEHELVRTLLRTHDSVTESPSGGDPEGGRHETEEAGPSEAVRERPHARIRLTHLPVHVEELIPGDRKSTRLNSSHVSISYAVFCLKKKN